MKRIKSYEDACKVLGIRPKTKCSKSREYVLTYIQLTTVIRAINYLETGDKNWKPNFEANKHTHVYYIYCWIPYNRNFNTNKFFLFSDDGLGCSAVSVGVKMLFATCRGARHVMDNFKDLLIKYHIGYENENSK